MKVISLNTNGIRSAIKKGLIPWLESVKADVICIQETKMQATDDTAMMDILPGYYAYYHDAEKKGYSGVALLSKIKPDKVHYGMGWATADSEGRYLQADYGSLSVVSVYMPSGSSGPERQAIKFKFLDHFFPFLKAKAHDKRDYIICGDWNIAHKNIDLKNWRSNQKNSGFLPEERAWLDRVFDELHYVDAFRVLNQEPDQYTWWSNRGQAYAKNVGWRIDYQVISPSLRSKLISTSIYNDKRFSDHAPLIMNYDLEFAPSSK